MYQESVLYWLFFVVQKETVYNPNVRQILSDRENTYQKTNYIFIYYKNII